jgi:hypothetical protein
LSDITLQLGSTDLFFAKGFAKVPASSASRRSRQAKSFSMATGNRPSSRGTPPERFPDPADSLPNPVRASKFVREGYGMTEIRSNPHPMVGLYTGDS